MTTRPREPGIVPNVFVRLINEKFMLKKVDQVYTEFESALLSMTTPAPGNVSNFVKMLQEKLDERLETPPTTRIIAKPF